jgi:hypothetical protein
LKELGLPYHATFPDLNVWPAKAERYQLCRNVGDEPVTGSDLSAGERVVLKLYELAFAPMRLYTLYLFDDIDGFLHPSLLKKFVNLVQKRLIEREKRIVLWATHSPVLVQLALTNDFFYIAEYKGVPQKTTRAKLVHELTAGELIVFDNTAFVFVEGQDHDFYNDLIERFQREGVVELTRQVKFISPKVHATSSDSNKHAVINAVHVLKNCGFSTTFFGLVDRDDGRATSLEGVTELGRYSVENYWADPLNVYSWYLDNDEYKELPEEIRFHALAKGMGSRFLERIDQVQKQMIVDHFSRSLCQSLSKDPNVLLDRESVSFLPGVTLNYPKFLLYEKGKEIIGRGYCNINSQLNSRALRKAFLKGAIWPEELVKKIQEYANALMA